MKTFASKSSSKDTTTSTPKILAAFPTRHPLLQPKLKIGQLNDKYEQEADRVADQVMRMPETGCPECREEEDKKIQTKPIAEQITSLVQRQKEPEKEEEDEETPVQAKQSSNQTSHITPGLQSQIQSMKGGGQPLPKAVRNYFEPRFGHDFSQVRVSTDARSAESAKTLNARAYTVDRHIMFGQGEFRPTSARGRRLLAHELAHIVQQHRGDPSCVSDTKAAEAEAAEAAKCVASGARFQIRTPAVPGVPMRDPLGVEPITSTKNIEYNLDNFKIGKSDLKIDHEKKIIQAAKEFNKLPFPEISYVTVVGHADKVGKAPENKTLGQQRANKVRNALIREGVPNDKVRAYSLGDTIPLVEGRPLDQPRNRRVTIRITGVYYNIRVPHKPATTLGPLPENLIEPGYTLPMSEIVREVIKSPHQWLPEDIRKLAENKGAKGVTTFQELAEWLTDTAPFYKNEFIVAVGKWGGMDKKDIKKAQIDLITAGLGKLLGFFLQAQFGAPTEPQPWETGPPLIESKFPSTLSYEWGF